MDDAYKYQMLLALHKHACTPNPNDIKCIESQLRGAGTPQEVLSGYIGYYCGKRIEINFNCVIDPQLYNRYNGNDRSRHALAAEGFDV